jgi:hypothetical protein
VAVAAGAAAVIGAGASYAGSKKQSDAAKKGSQVQLGMFDTLNRQQQPYIQSGYGAMSRLNTLLGIGGSPGGGGTVGTPAPGPAYRPTAGGGVQQVAQEGPQPDAMNTAMPGGQNMRLRQILALRAQNGDTESARILRQV